MFLLRVAPTTLLHLSFVKHTAPGTRCLMPDEQELWLPVMVPTHSTSIDLSVWHKEITGREVVAHTYFDFNSVATMPAKPAGGGKKCVHDALCTAINKHRKWAVTMQNTRLFLKKTYLVNEKH